MFCHCTKVRSKFCEGANFRGWLPICENCEYKTNQNKVHTVLPRAIAITWHAFCPHTAGQFWNKQVEVRALTDKEAVLDTKYKVTINSPFSGRREFIGEYYPVTWDLQTTPCLYAGSDDGSPVIEGHLSDYEAGGLFNPDFVYSQFTGERCG